MTSFKGSPYRRAGDLEAGGSSRSGDLDDDDISSDPFDIPNTKNAPLNRLRRWRMPRKNADERPLYWSADSEVFLLECLYEYHCANNRKQPESRDYNQWAIQMTTFFDGYVPAGERLKEKRRRLSKVYAAFKMLQTHIGVGWDSVNKTFTCSEDLRKDLSKRNREVNTIFLNGWKLNDMHLAAIFPNRVVATGARSYHPSMEQEHVDGVPSNDIRAGIEEPQNEQNSPYQDNDDDDIRVEFGRRMERQRMENATNVASSSRTIRKRSTRACKSNDSTREQMLEAVKGMRNDLQEDIRASKETLPSNNTVSGPSEVSLILWSLVEMGIDPRTRVHEIEKIAKDDTWCPLWAELNDSSRRAFLEDFVQQPQTPFVPNPYSQPPQNFSHVPNPYSHQPTPFGQPPSSFQQPPNPYNHQPPSFGQPPSAFTQPNPYSRPPTP